MHPLRILVADDSASVGEFICQQLRSNGHHVTLVASGEAAVAAFQANPPELVLMDIEMPGIGGLEAIRQMRQIPLALWVPIIIITANTDEANLLASFTAGADDFLSKPVQPLLLKVRIQAMMRIVASQRSTATMIDHVIEGVVRIDRTGRITAFNRAAEKIFGYRSSEVLGRNVSLLMPAHFRQAHDQHIDNYAATGQRCIIGCEREVTGLRKNGQTFPMQLGFSEAETPEDNFFIGLIRDLTVEKELRSKLSESRTFLADLIENSPAATFIKNREGRYLLVNHRYEQVTGLQRSQILGKSDRDLVPAEVAERYRTIDEQVMRSGSPLEAEEVFKSAQGDTHFLTIKFPTRNEAGEINGICGIATDISELKRTQQQLERLSQSDELTGLVNRRHFISVARHEITRCQRYGGDLSVLMLDIDHFKKINDGYGHPAGDKVLARIGTLFRSMLRDSDIAARMGGEEFAILLPHTSAEHALLVGERIRTGVAATTIDVGQGKTLRCTLSVGVATLHGKGADLEQMLHAADQALYAAKHGGRNRVCCAPPEQAS